MVAVLVAAEETWAMEVEGTAAPAAAATAAAAQVEEARAAAQNRAVQHEPLNGQLGTLAPEKGPQGITRGLDDGLAGEDVERGVEDKRDPCEWHRHSSAQQVGSQHGAGSVV